MQNVLDFYCQDVPKYVEKNQTTNNLNSDIVFSTLYILTSTTDVTNSPSTQMPRVRIPFPFIHLINKMLTNNQSSLQVNYKWEILFN